MDDEEFKILKKLIPQTEDQRFHLDKVGEMHFLPPPPGYSWNHEDVWTFKKPHRSLFGSSWLVRMQDMMELLSQDSFENFEAFRVQFALGEMEYRKDADRCWPKMIQRKWQFDDVTHVTISTNRGIVFNGFLNFPPSEDLIKYTNDWQKIIEKQEQIVDQAVARIEQRKKEKGIS